MTASTSMRTTDLFDGQSVLTETTGWVEDFSDPTDPVISVRTRTVTRSNERGEVVARTVQHHRSSEDSEGETVEQMLAADLDGFGRVTRALHLSDTTPGGTLETSREFDCCGLAKDVDQFGVATYFTYDELGRQTKMNSLGVTTETRYQGLVTSVHRYPEGLVAGVLSKTSQAAPSNEISRRVSNLRGETVSEWARSGSDAALRETVITTGFNPGGGIGRRVTTHPPQTAAEITASIQPESVVDYFLDGSTASESGNLGPAISYSYETDAIGLVSKQSSVEGANLRETVATVSDWAGRTVRMVYASDADGDSELDYAEFGYNASGQLVRETDPDGLTKLYAYNNLGERTTTAVDLNGNGAINPGVDRVTLTEKSLHATEDKFETVTQEV
ncbi:RHS repeat domain-containing protein [Luteolibacter sp. Populi]|uniref:RHS repeat domain-containing protein n=1 Tax=Luteolibacter sp. Populi TaxID=3230487 RepID=UPI003466922A